jgi:hypothetical protein
MRHANAPPVALVSVKQLPGRFVRITSSRARAARYERGISMSQEWQAQPYLKDERDAKFFAGAAVHNQWPTLAMYTCCAIVRGKRCNRIAIRETQHKHCIRHAGPTAARAYRENCRRLFESGRYPAHRWFKDEERRTRTRLRDRQRRKRGGWVLPGLTLRFSPEIEGRFRGDAALVLQGRPWDAVPDFHRDQLRWTWRKFCLDRQKPASWDAKGRAIMLDLRARGPVPEGGLLHSTGHEPHVLFVDRRCTAFSWRSRLASGEIERALAAPATVQKAIVRRERGLRSKSAVSDQGGVPRSTRAKTAADEQTETDRLLQLYRRDLRDVLSKVQEPGWPRLLRAYDAYVQNPTGPTHRAYMAARRAASI